MPPPSANAENARNTLERRIVVVIEIAFAIFLNAFFIIKSPYLRIIASDIFLAVSEMTFVVTTTAPATGTADEAAVVAVVAAVVAARVAPAVVACVAVAEATCVV